jgi:hypothetical protein
VETSKNTPGNGDWQYGISWDKPELARAGPALPLLRESEAASLSVHSYLMNEYYSSQVSSEARHCLGEAIQ